MKINCQSFGKLLTKRAQTAAELAVFGSILIFVIGVIVRTAMSSSQTMNHQLKAMRMALTQSYISSMQNGLTSRNTANITIVEDRLSVDVNNKLGTRDRIPLIVSGSGSMTNQLFQPIGYGERKNLAIYDVFINGQQFPFLTADFREVPVSPNHPGYVAAYGAAGHPNWVADCYDIPSRPNPIVGQPPLPAYQGGCVLFYKVVGNYPASADWCAGTTSQDCGNKNLRAIDRFNLDHSKAPTPISDVTPNCNAAIDVACSDLREKFSWQWIMAPGLRQNSLAWGYRTIKDGLGASMSGREFKPLKEARDDNDTEEDEEGKIDEVWDVDGDGKEEIVYDLKCRQLSGGDVDPRTGVINCLRVADSQAGDMDFTQDDRNIDKNKPLGLQDDVQMFSFTRGVTGGPAGNKKGTYLLVEEGKLFDPASGQFIRHTNRQNHVDIVQRIFRFSNDTNRFCDASGTRVDTVSGLPNPVEVCNNCFAADRVTQTCMDEQQKLIFIRSRIADLRGRRWVTKTGAP